MFINILPFYLLKTTVKTIILALLANKTYSFRQILITTFSFIWKNISLQFNVTLIVKNMRQFETFVLHFHTHFCSRIKKKS